MLAGFYLFSVERSKLENKCARDCYWVCQLVFFSSKFRTRRLVAQASECDSRFPNNFTRINLQTKCTRNRGNWKGSRCAQKEIAPRDIRAQSEKILISGGIVASRAARRNVIPLPLTICVDSLPLVSV